MQSKLYKTPMQKEGCNANVKEQRSAKKCLGFQSKFAKIGFHAHLIQLFHAVLALYQSQFKSEPFIVPDKSIRVTIPYWPYFGSSLTLSLSFSNHGKDIVRQVLK